MSGAATPPAAPGYAAVVEIASGIQMVGDRWETRFSPTTIALRDTEEAARDAIREFVAAQPVGRGRTYNKTWVEKR